MRRWVVPVFVAIIALSTAVPTNDRVKRAEETVMYGNQQNLAHRTVKKSGPVPLHSKLAEKQAEVAAKSEDDPVRELADVIASARQAEPEKELRTLMSHGSSEPNAPLIEEQKRHKPDNGERKKKQDMNMGDKPKREKPTAAASNEESENRDFDDARYLYLLKQYGPGPFMLDREGSSRRRKRAVSSKLSGSRLNRIRRDLSKISSESHMSASSQHRKKRDIEDMDPNQLAMLEYMLSRSNDGYETPEEVVEPTYTEEDSLPMEYEPQEVERRGMLDDYSRYAVAKRVPDVDEAPEEMIEEREDPVSVYDSEYGPVEYGLIEHEGVTGLFVPMEQESMRRLLSAEERDRDEERSRLRILSTILNLNQRRRK